LAGKDQVTWQQVKSYLEKHLEVEVEEEVRIDTPDSWWLKEVAPANEKNSRAEVHLENGSVIPVYLPRKFLMAAVVAVPAFVC